jgi:hypothetical protein
MKVEIEKEICNICGGGGICPDNRCAQKTCNKLRTTTSSLTALIIKWLEGKKEDFIGNENYRDTYYKEGRNDLITELIGEVR